MTAQAPRLNACSRHRQARAEQAGGGRWQAAQLHPSLAAAAAAAADASSTELGCSLCCLLPAAGSSCVCCQLAAHWARVPLGLQLARHPAALQLALQHPAAVRRGGAAAGVRQRRRPAGALATAGGGWWQRTRAARPAAGKHNASSSRAVVPDSPGRRPWAGALQGSHLLLRRHAAVGGIGRQLLLRLTVLCRRRPVGRGSAKGPGAGGCCIGCLPGSAHQAGAPIPN